MNQFLKLLLISGISTSLLIVLFVFDVSDKRAEQEAISEAKKELNEDSKPEIDTRNSELLQKPQVVHARASTPGIPLNNQQSTLPDAESFTRATLAQDCREVPADNESMESWLEEALFYEEHPDYIRETEELYTKCLGADRNFNYLDTLISQAEKGNVDALNRYIDTYEPEVYAVLKIPNTDREAMIAARQELQHNKVRLIEANILLGNEFVIAQASWEWVHIVGKNTQFSQLTLLYYLKDHSVDDGYFDYANEAITLWQGSPNISNEVFAKAKQDAAALAGRIKQNKQPGL